MHAQHFACSPVGIEESLKEAESLCEKRGGKLTPLRRKVLTLLLEWEGPAKAYDLLQRLDDGGAKPPSVYRSLDFLLDMGLAHRIECLNAFVPCGHWGHGHSAVFLICDVCGDAGELHASGAMEPLNKAVAAEGFRPRMAVVEIRGRCSACAAKAD